MLQREGAQALMLPINKQSYIDQPSNGTRNGVHMLQPCRQETYVTKVGRQLKPTNMSHTIAQYTQGLQATHRSQSTGQQQH
jgi:hypothetical protein